jgi:hypothetical protein
VKANVSFGATSVEGTLTEASFVQSWKHTPFPLLNYFSEEFVTINFIVNIRDYTLNTLLLLSEPLINPVPFVILIIILVLNSLTS